MKDRRLTPLEIIGLFFLGLCLRFLIFDMPDQARVAVMESQNWRVVAIDQRIDATTRVTAEHPEPVVKNIDFDISTVSIVPVSKLESIVKTITVKTTSHFDLGEITHITLRSNDRDYSIYINRDGPFINRTDVTHHQLCHGPLLEPDPN